MPRLTQSGVASALIWRMRESSMLASAGGLQVASYGSPVTESSATCNRNCTHRNASSSAVAASVFSSRYFTIIGVAIVQRVLFGERALHRARAGDDHRAVRDLQRAVGGAAIDLAAHDVVDRRRSGEHDAGADDGARADDRSFVDAAVAADDDVVFDDHRQVADRLEHAADLRGRRRGARACRSARTSRPARASRSSSLRRRTRRR